MHYVGLSKALRGAHTPNLDPGVDGIVLRRPLGVVGAIVPWNFPTTLLCNKLAPALVAGNTVVAKPAATTPLTTLRFAELLAEGGLPEGVFNVVTGRGSEAGEALVTHPLTRKIAFTGSTPVGERIMALAARGTKRVTLELGGSDPMIICDDADLAAAASAASMGRFYNCGQACLAIKRVYVFESVADEVIAAIVEKAKRLKVGRGDVKGTQMGPMHTAGGRDEMATPGVAHAAKRRWRAVGRRRTARRPRPRRRLLLRADGRRRPAARLADGDRGGVRARAPDLARQRPRRGDRARERLPVRPRFLGLDERPPASPRSRRRGSRRATPGSTRARRSTTSSRSAAGSPAATARSTGSRPSTSTPRRSRSCSGPS